MEFNRYRATWLSLGLYFIVNTLLAQSEINGKVVDQQTGEAIPYCNISASSSSIGTASNELGEFVIAVDSLPARLVFSHIVYGQQVVEVTQVSDITVALDPYVANLDEVVVLASKKDVFAEKLVRQAYEKADKASNSELYGKAFYRQKTKNGNNFSEFSEIFYNIRYNSRGIADWNIVEGRYALNEDAVHNRNFTALSRLLRPLQPNTEELIFPLHPGFEVYYEVSVSQIIEAGSSKIAVVQFRPLDDIKAPIFEGNVYIDTNTYDILQINGKVERDDLKLLKLSTNNGYWKDYTLTYEIVYKPNGNTRLLDHIKVDQAFDYYKNDKLLYHSITTSNLTFYEHYAPGSTRRLGGKITRDRSDWENLDEIGYNQRFWANNPIVKRTPVEEEVIRSFEQDNAFSSIFLNSAENIALLEANLSEDPFIKKFTKSVNNYNAYNPIEKVFLHTDKEIFSSGEPLWFSAYTVIGPFHELTAASRVLHVDLIAPDNEIVLSQTHELLNGRGSGLVELPKNLTTGDYQIRAYTQWMRNYEPEFFFTKTIKILSGTSTDRTVVPSEQPIDLQFFPEGGHAIAGIASKIAFKAIGADGLSRSVKGKVFDAQGQPVTQINSLDRGAGFFQLLPKDSSQFVAVLDDGSRHPLPKVLTSGYTMSVNNTNERSVKVIVQASPSLRGQSFYVIGHMRGYKYYQGVFNFDKNNIVSFEVPKQSMPSGVLTLTLFDADQKPRCERPVFVNSGEDLIINAKVESQNLKKRGKINMTVKVTDAYGRPVKGDFSVAVTDKGQVEKSQDGQNMLTQLLLQSDLKGNIEEPNQLLKDQKRSTLNRLDLVMLTHGWRKFPWQEVMDGQLDQKVFSFEKGLVLSGKATSKYGNPLPNVTLNIVAKSGEVLGMYTAKTEVGGKFTVPDFNFNGETQLGIHAFDQRDNNVDVKITLDKNVRVGPPAPQFTGHTLEASKAFDDYLTLARTRNRFNSLYDFDSVTALEEVVVTEDSKKSRKASPSTYGQNPDATIYAEDYIAAQTVLQLVQLFPGVSVNGTSVSIRNSGSPLWVLNGIPIYDENRPSTQSALVTGGTGSQALPGSTLSIEQSIMARPAPSFVTTMDTYTIERIEMLRGASAAIYGSRGANGVILIYTKKGEGRPPVLSGDLMVTGHTATRAFYSPKYYSPSERHEKPDYRATLYWNPSFTTDTNGQAEIEFFNSDNAERLEIDIQGLTPSGIPGAYLKTFER
ncbi:carboxypeptidase-like regulatory domain-containing protein [Pareuzebyella sediminis]|uniref:carboxypeptidase-like regulatory domain-containing protein n=1 Tax=Pareuzebyella sediminis TaxID=2607998 RepID=UPI0011EC89D9|nr:carboxypeptidase-like regulatory domain-containing protein [Pareuzebyella sediminis]